MSQLETQKYTADDIVELKFPISVREKVGMYLGDSGQGGFFHTLTEIVDNSLDEFVAGYGNRIEISIDSKNNSISVRDYGRGIPFENTKNGVSALYLAMTTLHAGGKHKKADGKSAYKYSSGINGVGASAVNAVSDYFIVRSYKDSKQASIRFENGLVKDTLVITENSEKIPNGTYVEWKPSVRIDEFDHHNVFESDCIFTKEDVIEKLQFIPYLNIGLEVELIFDSEKIVFKRQEKPENILSFNNQTLVMEKSPYFKEELCLLLDRKTTNRKIVSMDEYIEIPEKEKLNYEVKNSHIELCFNFTENSEPMTLNFANGIKIQGGKPDQAFKLQFKQILNSYLQEQGKKMTFESEDIFTSLTFMLSVKINQPEFSGQTKDKLNNPESSVLTTNFCKKYLNHWINRLDKDEISKIIRLIEVAKKIREASKKMKEAEYKSINQMKESELSMQKGKLEDCTSNDPTKNELYIVEGDSASGGIRISRSNKYQAFIPLRGKILNVLKKANQGKVFKNEEVKSLAYALGGINDDFDIEKLKYHKIIILADADLDGFHISALMMTFFFKFYPEIIQKGYLYVALSPLFKIMKGNTTCWAWNYEDMKKVNDEMGGNCTVIRNKGLGEMNPNDLFDTTLNPLNRKFVQIQMSEFENLEPNIEVFMGDTNEGKEKRDKIFKKYYHDNIDKKTIITLTTPEV